MSNVERSHFGARPKCLGWFGSLDLLAESVELCGKATAILSTEEMQSKREIAIFGSLFEKSALQDDKTKTTNDYSSNNVVSNSTVEKSFKQRRKTKKKDRKKKTRRS
jgi:hypothetical protein